MPTTTTTTTSTTSTSTTTTTTTTVPCHIVTANGDVQHSTAQAKFGSSSILFDGTGDYLSVPNSPVFDFGGGDFTIEFFVRPNVLAVGNGFISSELSSTKGWNVIIGLSGDSVRFTATNVSSEAIDLVTGGSTLVTGSWQHIAVVRNGNTFTIWIGGVDRSNTTSTYDVDDGNSQLVIGRAYGNLNDSYYNGWMEGIKIVKGTAVYTSAFTPPTAPPSWQAGTVLLINSEDTDTSTTFIDESCNPSPGTTTTTTTTTTSTTTTTTTTTVPCHIVTANGDVQHDTAQSKFGTSSILFDGTGDYLSVPNAPAWDLGTGDFTIDFWVRPNAISNSDGFISCRSSTLGWMVALRDTAGEYAVRFISDNDIAQTINFESTPNTLFTGIWQHVAVVRNGTSFKIYIDGVEKGSTTSSFAVDDGGVSLTVGVVDWGSINYYDGWMEGIRITKGVARWTTGFTPDTSAPTWEVGLDLLINSEDTDTSTTFIDESCDPPPGTTTTTSTSTTTTSTTNTNSTTTTTTGSTTTSTTSTSTTTTLPPTQLFIDKAWLFLLKESIDGLKEWLLQNDIKPEVTKGWLLSQKSDVQKSWSLDLQVLQEKFKEWVLHNWGTVPLSREWGLRNDIDLNIKAIKEWSVRNVIDPYEIVQSQTILPIYKIEIDGVDVTKKIAGASINISEGQYANTCELVFSDILIYDTYQVKTKDKTERIVITINNTDVYKFLFEERSASVSFGKRNFLIWGRSKIAILDKPYVDKLTGTEFEPAGTLSSIVNKYASGFNITIENNVLNYGILPKTLLIEGKTPIDIINEVAESAGAIVRSGRINSLIIRKKYPNLKDIKFLIPDYSFNDLQNIITLEEEDILSSGFNASLVEGKFERDNFITGRWELDEDRNGSTGPFQIGTPLWIRLYTFPIITPDKYSIDISEGALNSTGTIFEQVNNEQVSFIQGDASTRYPIKSILFVSWIGNNLGSIQIVETNNNLLELVSSSLDNRVGIARVTYTTQFDLYQTVGILSDITLTAALKPIIV